MPVSVSILRSGPVWCALLLFFSGSSPASDSAQQKRDQAALIRVESEFEKARTEKGMEGWLSFFAASTVDLSPGLPIAFTKAELRRRLLKEWNPDTVLKWKPVKAEVSQSGDLGYTVGTWQITFKSKKSEHPLTGKYVTIWKKQKDGSWKVALDTGNADPPAH